VLELYERFQRDPRAVDPATRRFFETWTPPADVQGPGAASTRTATGADPRVLVGAVNLAQSIRLYGHLAAQIDPLGSRPLGDPALLPETHGVGEADLRALPATLDAGPAALGASSMWDVVERLRGI
jgi:2-oxoglutarate dehydrogenase E1 component